jgi:uncharacterized protein (DUF2252 family)
VDVVRQIRAFNAGRDPERVRLKYRAMRASPFAFLRGTCHLFYDRLPRGGVFKSAPSVWACGDLHLENFGSYRGDNGLVYFDINDFDEAALAPASWDLVRLLASLCISADRLDVGTASARTAGTLCQRLLDGYASALAQGKAYWVERDTAQGLVRELLDGLRQRDPAPFSICGPRARADDASCAWTARRRLRRRPRSATPSRASSMPTPSRSPIPTSIRCSTWRDASQAPAASAWTAT